MQKTQFSLVLANKAGELARLAQALAQGEVNVEALSISDGIHAGVVKVVVDKPDAARRALRAAELNFAEHAVLAVPLPNAPGALAALCSKLAADGLNIDYVYGSTCSCGGKSECGCQSTLMLSAADLSTAESAVGLVAGGWPRP